CDWECVGQVEQKFARRKARGQGYAALVLEPLMQGAAGMIPQPAGWLGRVAELARGHGAQLIADEVMTGFGRTGLADTPAMRAAPEREKTGAPGLAPRRPMDQSAGAPLGARLRSASKARDGRAHPPVSMSRFPSPPLFACHHEGVQPDILCLAKGLTGGYLPMAATLTTQEVFDAFLGEYEEFKTFFHGHSFTSNQLGAAAALASLDLLESKASLHDRFTLERILREQLASLWSLSNVGDIRQTGLIAGVELVKDWRTRRTFPLGERAGIRVCEAMARRGVLTRPVGNVVVLMPPYCTTPAQLCRIISVLGAAIAETLAAP
ncbi:MAG: aminotransferase class III-fold pyridoxal phosphate-dependent enzyme, partial [Verrucomicrobia bacterium]|nr:aminotransferase class III-fold pyridoxal phosphate-dependent enzyme [Verrucomicrobiota bacterium]